MLVRKQFHIDEKQDRALKRRAKQLGISETEIVRRAIALVLREGQENELPPADHDVAVAGLIESMTTAARKHELPKGWKLDRERLYAERDEELVGRLRS